MIFPPKISPHAYSQLVCLNPLSWRLLAHYTWFNLTKVHQTPTLTQAHDPGVTTSGEPGRVLIFCGVGRMDSYSVLEVLHTRKKGVLSRPEVE